MSSSRSIKKVILFLVVVLVVFLTFGCARQAREEARRVYVLQSGVASDLAWASSAAEDSRNSRRFEALIQAEEELQNACGGIKFIGYRKIWKIPFDEATALIMLIALEFCESTARDIDALYFRKLPPVQSSSLGDD